MTRVPRERESVAGESSLSEDLIVTKCFFYKNRIAKGDLFNITELCLFSGSSGNAKNLHDGGLTAGKSPLFFLTYSNGLGSALCREEAVGAAEISSLQEIPCDVRTFLEKCK